MKSDEKMERPTTVEQSESMDFEERKLFDDIAEDISREFQSK
jgi:hypothetical protein